ncbi:hypothetical protein FD755_021569 [Muntiacus reevesi]|uniref:BTB domain-containing protein n=1 Tax=Muntiacus reevesi TaxID=9886 RepID=A0A5N3W1P8_MUNRE|nr:hypothetical protein FD755_021569 [Muntiacus reevesi]
MFTRWGGRGPEESVQEMLTGQRLCQSESHNDSVLAALNQQRSAGVLCDVTLIAEEQKFHAHKAVLAACSDYFRIFLKSALDVVKPGDALLFQKAYIAWRAFETKYFGLLCITCAHYLV